jgi:hypothetical protein
MIVGTTGSWGSGIALIGMLMIGAATAGHVHAGAKLPGASAPGGGGTKSTKAQTYQADPRDCHTIATQAANGTKQQTGSESKAQQTYSQVKLACQEARK